MKFKFILLFAFIYLYSGSLKAENLVPKVDSTCCSPDSLKVISTNSPTFCVSWRVSKDSACSHPYGFTIQWRPYPGNSAWSEKSIIYSSGSTVTFCDSISNCGNYQWRVRAICDSSSNPSYSSWVYGNKFSMNCIGKELATTQDAIIFNDDLLEIRGTYLAFRKPDKSTFIYVTPFSLRTAKHTFFPKKESLM